MGAVTLSAEAAIELAMKCTCSPTLRVVLLAGERAGSDGAARFSHGELSRLLAEGRSKPLSGRAVGAALTQAVTEGYLMPSRTKGGAVQVNPALVRAHGFGQHVVAELEDDRVLVECATCAHRMTVRRERFEEGSTRCGPCLKRQVSAR